MSPLKVKGPAQVPSLTSKTEDFLKSLLPFRAYVGGVEAEILHIDKYLFVIRSSSGIGLVYKASLNSLHLPDAIGDKLTEHLTK